MEQKELISNMADLMNVIKEDYKAKASNKWLIISLFLLLGKSVIQHTTISQVQWHDFRVRSPLILR